MTDDTTNNDGKQKPVNLLTSQQSFIQDDKSVVRKTDQAIPQAFLSELRRTREDSVRHNTGDYQSVAKVPVAVHEKWKREGFDMFKETPKAILKRLRDENLDAFITTNKRL